MIRLNFASIFTREEPVGGLEISESAVRLALFEIDKKTSVKRPSFFIEEPIPEGVIAKGLLQDPQLFIAALENLVKKMPRKLRFVIASVPADLVYSKIFSFPRTVQGAKLEESMKLTVGFQLPVKTNDVYLDWEKIESGTENNEVLFASAPKTAIDAYLAALKAAKLNPIAIEFHPLSLLRALHVLPGETIAMKTVNKDAMAVFVATGKTLRFSRTLPLEFVAPDKQDVEARKVIDFYESEHGPVAKIIDAKDAPMDPQLQTPEIKDGTSKWLISFGAAIRGISPRNNDTIVSLMPVGTEEAYEYHKAIIFSEFVSNMTIGISVFFALAFAAMWAVMVSIQSNTLAQLEKLSALPAPADAATLEARATNLNNLTAALANIMKASPQWSGAMSQIQALAGSGILVTNFSLPSTMDAVNISGIAKTRNDLDSFKKAVNGASFAANARFGATDLAQTTNIPFSATFQITDQKTFFGLTNNR